MDFLYNAGMDKQVQITKLAYGGEGIGIIDGKICFVENALPGETVIAKITETKPRFLRGKTRQILQASPARVAPPCVYVEQCGGCQYQHVDYTEELKWKEIQVREHLTRNLKIAPELVRPITASEVPYGYRGSVTIHEEHGRRGFFAKDNRTLIEIKSCLLASPALADVFKMPAQGGKPDTTYRVSKDGKMVSSHNDSFFEIEVGGQTLITHSKSFFQNNLEMTAAMAEKIRRKAVEAAPQTFVDLYAGVGTFTFLSAPKTTLVLAEESSWGLQALEKNLEKQGLKGEVLKGKVEKIFPSWLQKSNLKKAMVVVDPPRTGMAGDLAEKLGEHPEIENLAYVSCHLGTLTRDLGLILKKGRLKVDSAFPFDMFPRTKHIEILVFLSPA